MQRLRYSKFFKPGILFIDAVLISVFLYFQEEFPDESNILIFFKANTLSFICLGLLIWFLIAASLIVYQVQRQLLYSQYVAKWFQQIFLFGLFLFLIKHYGNHNPNSKGLLFPYIYSSFLFLAYKTALFYGVKRMRSSGINIRNVQLLGREEGIVRLKTTFEDQKNFGYFIQDVQSDFVSMDKLIQIWREKGIHSIFISDNWLQNKEFYHNFFHAAYDDGVVVHIVPSMAGYPILEHEISYFESQPILIRAKFPLERLSNKLLKRTFDLLFSATFLLVIGWWLLPLISLIIYVKDNQNPLYFQKRFGKNFKPFYCIKFRTMRTCAATPACTTQRNDPRITSLGKFLRKYSLDEFPQFINVLAGHMSIVGPRPHMTLVDEDYRAQIPLYAVRSKVKPGITGLAQVSGLRGDGDAGEDPDKMLERMSQRIMADQFYIKNWTLFLDLSIIVRTFFQLLKGDNDAF